MREQKKASKKESIEAISKAFEKFLDNFSPFFDQLEIERKNVHKLIEKEPINRGKILNYHLVLENFIERVLTASIPDYNPEKLRLNFANKVELLPTTNKFYRLFLDGIKTINRIRNKYAHNLNFEISEEDVKELRPIVETANRISYRDKKKLTPIEIVEQFVNIVCTILIFYTPELMTKSMELRKEYPGIFNMFEGIGKDCNSLNDLVNRYNQAED